MDYSYVYKLTNKTNKKCYIGKSNTPSRRLTRHFSIAKTGYCKNNKFQLIHKAIAKYGRENFTFEILEKCDKSIVFKREKYWIKFYKSNNLKFGYNLSKGGAGGSTPSKETREKISKTLSGRINSLNGLFKKLYKLFSLIPGYKSKIYISKNEYKRIDIINDILKDFGEIQRGVLNDNVKKDIVKLKKAGPFRVRDLAKIFNLKEKTIKYVLSKYKNGVPTEEQKRKNRSEAKKGKKLSKEHRRKISEGNKGKAISKETREKISIKNSGSNNGMYEKTHSLETKEKMKQSQQKRRKAETKITNKTKGKAKPRDKTKNKKLPEELKNKIKTLYASNNYTKKQIAKQLNINYNTIVYVLR